MHAPMASASLEAPASAAYPQSPAGSHLLGTSAHDDTCGNSAVSPGESMFDNGSCSCGDDANMSEASSETCSNEACSDGGSHGEEVDFADEDLLKDTAEPCVWCKRHGTGANGENAQVRRR